MENLIIATENMGKFREITTYLGGEFERFYSLRDFEEKVEVREDSDVYIENALEKARKIGERFGIDTIADDSGLEVRALGGRPGVLSARYGRNDQERIERLLAELKGVPWEERAAIFKAYIVFYLPEKERGYIFYGHLTGLIGFERHGEGGFGYDPIFYVPSLNKYLAELAVEEKNRLSHRGRALQSFKKFVSSGSFRASRVSSR
jgi:XTP/dITP diphosphohydrolase